MNSYNQSPQQLAEQLAKKCAANAHDDFSEEWFNKLPKQTLEGEFGKVYKRHFNSANIVRKNIESKILQSTPLVELLECVTAMRKVQCLIMDKELAYKTNEDALTNLDTKLKQILGEQKE